MSDNALLGKGTLLKRYNGATYDAIADVGDIDGPGYGADSVDVTSQNDAKANGGYRLFKAALKDAGEVSVTLMFQPAEATHALLMDDYDAGDNVSYQIEMTDVPASTVTFDAHITSMSPSYPLEDKVAMDVTFKISGKPVWA